MGVRWGRLLAILWFSSVARQVSAEEAPRFGVAPPPSWVEAVSADLKVSAPVDEISSGVHVLLSDTQVRLFPRSFVRYRHLARRALSAEGVSAISQVSLSFDPSYQQLTIHHVRLVRGEESRDALKRESIKLIQEEEDLSAQIYNGRITALLVLEDVRPGDVIDFDYSLSGSNPVFGEHFSDDVALASSGPVQHLSYRLLSPSARALRYQVHGLELGPATTLKDGVRELRFERRRVAAIRSEDRVPSWFQATPFLELSDFESWAAVAKWAAQLFDEGRTDSSPELDQQIDLWRSQHAAPEARLRAALDFVQRDVRYFGIEMGASSHQPHRPREVFAQRFGDCKDKALLLASILNRLGIEARPALVHTGYRRTLDELLPSATVFDHAIVVATLDGQQHWLDATDSSARGEALSQRSSSEVERALIVDPRTTGLSVVPAKLGGALEVDEEFDIPDYQGSAQLRVRTRFSGDRAANERSYLAHISREELGRALLNYQARSDPGATMIAPPVVTDDEAANLIVLEERYLLPSFWKEQRRVVRAFAISDSVRSPSYPLRAMPLEIAHPEILHHRVSLNLPDAWNLDDARESVDGEAFHFDFKMRSEGRLLRYDFHYVSKVDNLAPSAVADHIAKLDAMYQSLSYTVRHGDAKKTSSLAAILGTIVPLGAMGLGLLGWMVLRGLPARLRRRRYRQVLAHQEGEAPGTAILIPSRDHLSQELRGRRCGACRSRGSLRAEPVEEARLGAQLLLVQRHRCERCQQEGRLYFAVKA